MTLMSRLFARPSTSVRSGRDLRYGRIRVRGARSSIEKTFASETDWPVGAAGFEPLHLEIRSTELRIAPEQDLGVDRAPETFVRSAPQASLIRDAQVRVLPPGLRVLANSDGRDVEVDQGN
jgi:hypothetical protein